MSQLPIPPHTPSDLSLRQQPALLRALAGDRPEVTPVWFMRQAGRSLPEYRAAREGIGMLDACLRPELAAEITCQPVRRHHVDAAIFFSDIMVPLLLAGVDVSLVPGVGPVIATPAREATTIARLSSHHIGDTSAIEQAARYAVKELGDPDTSPHATPLIAFAGAPFTVAAYVVEGRGSRDHLAARRLMHTDPDAWAELMEWVAQIDIAFLRAQIAGGARAVQLFDSWAGSLSAADYTRYCLPYSRRVLRAVSQAGIPTIHFATGASHLLPALAAPEVTCVGVDYRLSLRDAIDTLSTQRDRVIVQGNIDPALLAAPYALHDQARAVVEEGHKASAHIVNLGHGVPPDTDPHILSDLVSYIHELPVPDSARLTAQKGE